MGLTSFSFDNGEFSSIVVEAWQLNGGAELRHRKGHAL
jgi:hypothetical protein